MADRFTDLVIGQIGDDLFFLDMIDDGELLFDRDAFFENRLKILATRLEELGSKKVHFGDSWYWDLKPDLKPGERFSL